MVKTFRISFSLKNTYRVNAVLHALKHAPLLKKVIPDTVYSERGFKIFAGILSAFWELGSVFVGKIVYFLAILAASFLLKEVYAGETSRLLLHVLVFLSLVGATLNSYLFRPSRDKYYAIVLLGMKADRFTLVNYFYAIVKVLAGFFLCALLFFLPSGVSFLQCLLIPLSVAGVKMTADAYRLRKYEKRGSVKDESALHQCVLICLLLFPVLAAFGLPALGFALPSLASTAIMGLYFLAGLGSLYRIVTFSNYRPLMQELLFNGLALEMDDREGKKAVLEQSRRTISGDGGNSSQKKGFEFLNELFVKRHRKILWRTSLIQTVVICALWIGIFALLPFFPAIKKLNGVLLSFFPASAFLMYCLNRGTSFTRALFINCDHSLLTYSFYKQPKSILKLFSIRLREIVKINLLPAVAIGGGLPLFLFASGGTDQALHYLVLAVSPPCLSVFFSVHYLALYYLLQPYNAGTEVKSVSYQIVYWATYLVCYLMLELEIPLLAFGIGCVAFCVLYCAVACILIYLLSPKTFKLRS